jgi:hypothetical protein
VDRDVATHAEERVRRPPSPGRPSAPAVRAGRPLAALARALAARTPVSNRAVGRYLAREETAVAVRPARDIILGRAQEAVGAVEGSAEFTQYVAEPETLRKARADAAAKGRKHTTCIDFFTRAWGLVRQSRKKGEVPFLPNLYAPAAHAGWVEAKPGMADDQRPAAGDVYILSKIATEGGKEKKGGFSHVGIVESLEPYPDDPDREYWVTIDAGQPYGDAGLEQVARSKRVYVKSTNRITGEKLQGGQERLLTGWWNVDLLATKP